MFKSGCCLLFIASFLSACTPVHPKDESQRSMCQELKSRIVFNGATGNTRRAEIQSAEKTLQMRSYDANCSN